MKRTSIRLLLVLPAILHTASAREIHVAIQGDDQNDGSAAKPLRTISAAASAAQPGDTVTVHAGTYRERVNPPRGGESDAKRIVYQAIPGAMVEIKGSEVVKDWQHETGDVWKATLPKAFFGDFNPFADPIRGDWFNGKGRKHHTGAVYLNGEWLAETVSLDEVMLPNGEHPKWLLPAQAHNIGALWFAEVATDGTTTVWAQFPDVDPNKELVEVNVRQAVFYPDQPGRNFITVRGFTMRHAATNWAPPTAEQVGLIGTHWSKGWIIENNTISHSVCTGITLGKHGDKHDNTSADTATGYVETIKRAQAFKIPWTRENIGHHIIRNNHISHCEQSGLVGSMGGAFSIIEDNHIHDINVRGMFTGAEQAGIKLHAPIDTIIRRNHIHRVPAFGGGIWLDWMTQGTRVTCNLLHDNSRDLWLEVNHGPYLVDNNIMLSGLSIWDWSHGGTFAHNLFGGHVDIIVDSSRETPFHEAHSTTMKGLHNIVGGDTRYYNNIFLGGGLESYFKAKLPMTAAGNVYLGPSQPLAGEKDPLTLPGIAAHAAIQQENGTWLLSLQLPPVPRKSRCPLVTSELLGTTHIAKLPYVNPDGSPLVIDTDFTGAKRGSPIPGPFGNPKPGAQKIKVW